MHGTRDRSLVREILQASRQLNPCATTTEPAGINSWSLCTYTLCSPTSEVTAVRIPCTAAREQALLATAREHPLGRKDPAQPTVNKEVPHNWTKGEKFSLKEMQTEIMWSPCMHKYTHTYICVCVCVLVTQSCLTLCDPWTVTCQAPVSTGFPRQKYWSGLPFPTPGDLPNPGIEPKSPALVGRFFPTMPPGKP